MEQMMKKFFSSDLMASLYIRGCNEMEVEELMKVYESEIKGKYVIGTRAHA